MQRTAGGFWWLILSPVQTPPPAMPLVGWTRQQARHALAESEE
jgi:hypothetical protein